MQTSNSIKDFLTKSKSQNSSLLISSMGGGRESIYKEELFKGFSDKEKKSIRKKIRNQVTAIFEALRAHEENKNQKAVAQLCNNFKEFYENVYKVHDYSFASIASENTKNKELITNALSIIRRELKIK